MAISSNDYRILMRLLSFLSPQKFRLAVAIIVETIGREEIPKFLEKFSEAQYQSIITEIVYLDTTNVNLSSRDDFYKKKRIEILNENSLLNQIEEIVNQMKDDSSSVKRKENDTKWAQYVNMYTKKNTVT